MAESRWRALSTLRGPFCFIIATLIQIRINQLVPPRRLDSFCSRFACPAIGKRYRQQQSQLVSWSLQLHWGLQRKKFIKNGKMFGF